LSSGVDSFEAAKAAIRRELESDAPDLSGPAFEQRVHSLGTHHRWPLLLSAVDAVRAEDEREYEEISQCGARWRGPEQEERQRTIDRCRPKLFDIWLVLHRAQLQEERTKLDSSATPTSIPTSMPAWYAKEPHSVILQSLDLDLPARALFANVQHWCRTST
jgi:hypothetical protein